MADNALAFRARLPDLLLFRLVHGVVAACCFTAHLRGTVTVAGPGGRGCMVEH